MINQPYCHLDSSLAHSVEWAFGLLPSKSSVIALLSILSCSYFTSFVIFSEFLSLYLICIFLCCSPDSIVNKKTSIHKPFFCISNLHNIPICKLTWFQQPNTYIKHTFVCCLESHFLRVCFFDICSPKYIIDYVFFTSTYIS